MIAHTHGTRMASTLRTVANDDRRDCPRIPLQSVVLRVNGRAYEGFGDVSTGGALWIGEPLAFLAAEADVSFELPELEATLTARAELLSMRAEPDGRVALHLRFLDLAFELERVIARHVDDCLQLAGHVARAA